MSFMSMCYFIVKGSNIEKPDLNTPPLKDSQKVLLVKYLQMSP